MQGTTESADVWVVARLAALERANRRLWVGLGALFMALVTLVAVAALLAVSFELPAGLGLGTPELAAGKIVADEISVKQALRVVDAEGRNLVWIGRESASAGTGAGQTVVGISASKTPGEAPQQALRLAASPLGAALSLGTPDGASSASLFVAARGASLELRRGEQTRVLSESDEAAVAAASREPAVSAMPAPAPTPASVGARAETPAVAPGSSGEAARGVPIDLTDPVLQSLGQGFYVGRLSLSDESGGLRVRGRIVNASSVDQLRVEFRLSIARRELPFTIARVAAGNSTPFAVEIPRAGNSELRDARMRWVRSTVSYGTE